MAFTVPAAATAAQLLELGSRSLLYFEHFGPRYQRWAKTVPENGDYATLHRRFYEQNGLSEERIGATADALRAVLADLRAQYQAQGDSTRGIAGVWQGAAATAEIALLNRQLAVAEADIAALAGISAEFDRLPGALRAALKGKAEIVLQILEHGTELKINGKTPEDVDLIIDGADGFGWTHTLSADSAASRAQALFPDMRLGMVDELLYGKGAVQTLWSPYQDVIAERCLGWLDEVFVPDYARKVRAFSEMCTIVDDGVRDLYEAVVAKFGRLSGEEYPRPWVSSGASPVEGAPVSTVPAGTTPSSTVPVEAVPSATTPAGTVPAATTPAATTPAATAPAAATPSAAVPVAPAPSATATPSPATTPTPSTPPTTSTPTEPTTPTIAPSTTLPITTALDGLSALSSAAQTLTPIAQSVAESLGTGLSALTDSVTAGIDDAMERVQQALEPVDADGDGLPDDRVLAGFPLGEQQAEVALGADGQLALTLTGADGVSAEYRLETDEHGHPVLVQVDPETGEKIEPEGESSTEPDPDDGSPPAPDGTTAPRDGSPGASESDAAPGTPAPGDPATADPAPENPGPAASAPGNPGPAESAPGSPGSANPAPDNSAPGNPAPVEPAPAPAPDDSVPPNNSGTGIPPTPRRAEDGEHRPQEFPDSTAVEPPEPNGDSGARLSEAGPL
ncbi:hypothetical protein [Nocardia sp. NPDC057353]|uniref:hypothetical protein n=1 Tax=Nocardia sp. NPDC057353 TaxID=3346104 RepID=UPI00363E17A2